MHMHTNKYLDWRCTVRDFCVFSLSDTFTVSVKGVNAVGFVSALAVSRDEIAGISGFAVLWMTISCTLSS